MPIYPFLLAASILLLLIAGGLYIARRLTDRANRQFEREIAARTARLKELAEQRRAAAEDAEIKRRAQAKVDASYKGHIPPRPIPTPRAVNWDRAPQETTPIAPSSNDDSLVLLALMASTSTGEPESSGPYIGGGGTFDGGGASGDWGGSSSSDSGSSSSSSSSDSGSCGGSD